MSGVSASLVLRGRWSASIDEVDTSRSSTVRGPLKQLRGLVRAVGDHQRYRLSSLDSLPDLLLQHQVLAGWLESVSKCISGTRERRSSVDHYSRLLLSDELGCG